jgi:diadenosine tetraphosphate (Ap4A) HIT family hydrolase
MADSAYKIYSDAHFVIEQCRDCAIAGYLIVSPLRSATAIDKLDNETLARLGLVLARAVKAVERAVSPLRVYCAQFGEQDTSVHFHIFPRTKVVTEAFLTEYPAQRGLIHGPMFLDWARETFKTDAGSSILKPSIDQLRHIISHVA